MSKLPSETIRDVSYQRWETMQVPTHHPASREFKSKDETYDQTNGNLRRRFLMYKERRLDFAQRFFWLMVCAVSIVIVILFFIYMGINIAS